MAKKLKYGKIWTKGNKQFRYAYCKIGKNTYKAKMVRDFARGAKPIEIVDYGKAFHGKGRKMVKRTKRAKRKVVKIDDVQRTLELRSPSTSVVGGVGTVTTYFTCERCGRSKARSLYHNKIKNNHLCATCTRRLKAGGFKIKNAKKASRRRLENPILPAPSRGIDS